VSAAASAAAAAAAPIEASSEAASGEAGCRRRATNLEDFSSFIIAAGCRSEMSCSSPRQYQSNGAETLLGPVGPGRAGPGIRHTAAVNRLAWTQPVADAVSILE